MTEPSKTKAVPTPRTNAIHDLIERGKFIEAIRQVTELETALSECNSMPQPCCGEYETCTRACTPRGEQLAYRKVAAGRDYAGELREAVLLAATTFRRYAKLHRDKGTEDGWRKAGENDKLAAAMEAALESVPEISQTEGKACKDIPGCDGGCCKSENEKGQTEAEALGFDRELSREVMESGDRAMAKLATENGIGNASMVPVPSMLIARLIDMHQDAADALVDIHGDPHRQMVEELTALLNGPSLGNVPLLVERVKDTARRFVNGEPCWCHHPINTGHKPNCADLRASLRAIEAMAVTSQFSMCPRGCGVSHDPAFACPAEGKFK